MADLGGRPSKLDSRERTERFLTLAAADPDRLDVAARTAGIDPYRALRLASDPSFKGIIDGLKAA